MSAVGSGESGGDSFGVATCAANLGDQRFGLVAATTVMHQDARPLLGEGASRRMANPARRAGDQRNLV
jgi:hypothetical protein